MGTAAPTTRALVTLGIAAERAGATVAVAEGTGFEESPGPNRQQATVFSFGLPGKDHSVMVDPSTMAMHWREGKDELPPPIAAFDAELRSSFAAAAMSVGYPPSPYHVWWRVGDAGMGVTIFRPATSNFKSMLLGRRGSRSRPAATEPLLLQPVGGAMWSELADDTPAKAKNVFYLDVGRSLVLGGTTNESSTTLKTGPDGAIAYVQPAVGLARNRALGITGATPHPPWFRFSSPIRYALERDGEIGLRDNCDGQLGPRENCDGQLGPRDNCDGQLGPRENCDGQLGPRDNCDGQLGPRDNCDGQLGPREYCDGQLGPREEIATGNWARVKTATGNWESAAAAEAHRVALAPHLTPPITQMVSVNDGDDGFDSRSRLSTPRARPADVPPPQLPEGARSAELAATSEKVAQSLLDALGRAASRGGCDRKGGEAAEEERAGVWSPALSALERSLGSRGAFKKAVYQHPLYHLETWQQGAKLGWPSQLDPFVRKPDCVHNRHLRRKFAALAEGAGAEAQDALREGAPEIRPLEVRHSRKAISEMINCVMADVVLLDAGVLPRVVHLVQDEQRQQQRAAIDAG
eukprot:gene28230-43862_t